MMKCKDPLIRIQILVAFFFVVHQQHISGSFCYAAAATSTADVASTLSEIDDGTRPGYEDDSAIFQRDTRTPFTANGLVSYVLFSIIAEFYFRSFQGNF